MQVTAVAYDNPIPGFHTNNTINLRLWAAKPDREFDLEAFNTGDYIQVLLLVFWLNDSDKGQFLNACRLTCTGTGSFLHSCNQETCRVHAAVLQSREWPEIS